MVGQTGPLGRQEVKGLLHTCDRVIYEPSLHLHPSLASGHFTGRYRGLRGRNGPRENGPTGSNSQQQERSIGRNRPTGLEWMRGTGGSYRSGAVRRRSGGCGLEKYVPVIDVPIPLTATQRMLLGLKHYRRNQNVNPQYRREITLEEHKTHVAEQFELIAKFMQYSEEFSKLDLEDKLVLFRSSWSMVHRVETVDRSLTLFGDEVFKDHKVACFLKFYVDRRLRYTDTGLGDEEAAKIDEMLLPSTESLIAVVAKPLLELKPTEFELVYIMSQLIWHVEGKGVSVACHEVADSYRERISDELHDYYIHEQRLPRYAERLIKIMELVHAIEDYLYERAQFLNMLNIFNVCKIEVEDADILDKNHV